MMSEPFDPASPAAWIAHGREPELAGILAGVWGNFPDLPPDAPPEERMERMRKRALALRPIMEAMSRTAEEVRQARNFAFTEARLDRREADDRDRAILRARTAHGFDWDRAVRYASGWYAAQAGWEPEARRPGCSTPAALAYDKGFADGGGKRDDLFDTARRAFDAASPSRTPVVLASGRPLPSTWPKPTDVPRPARWNRRLLILGPPEAGLCAANPAAQSGIAVLLPLLRACPGYGELTVIVITGAGFQRLADVEPNSAVLEPRSGAGFAADPQLDAQFRTLIAGRDFDDLLVAAQGPYLALLDAHARVLPLCRTMERTRNTALQQRGHFRTWLDRGISVGESLGAGHIRWGKAVKGLTGKLGEFTARYTGKLPAGGHRIVVEMPDGQPASGYVTAQGEPLCPETVIGNRTHLRKEMAACLRVFAGATRLSAA